MIPALFSTVKLINNEDSQAKEKVKEEEEEGLFNKLKFKVYWELLYGHTFTKHFMCITNLILFSSLFFTSKTVYGCKEIKHIT